jgi:uncharacterized protein with HEPN domain
MKDNKQSSLERLKHIRQAINEINSFIPDVDKENFLEDHILQSAVLFQFSVIGEAIAHVEPGILNKDEYTWYKVRAFRNLISHEYFNIKLEAVWNIILKDLPELQQKIDYIIKMEF